MSIRSLKARLKRLTPPAGPVIGEDVERDLRRRQELRCITSVPGLTAAEEVELAELNASLKKVDEERGRLSHLTMKDFRATHCDDEPLTDAERIELAELSKRHPPPMLQSTKAWVLALHSCIKRYSLSTPDLNAAEISHRDRGVVSPVISAAGPGRCSSPARNVDISS